MLNLARWAHTFDFRTADAEHHNSHCARFKEFQQNTPAFKHRKDGVTLFTVVAAYWLAASIFWNEQIIALINDLWQHKELKAVIILFIMIGLLW
jgi:hypothetical protein